MQQAARTSGEAGRRRGTETLVPPALDVAVAWMWRVVLLVAGTIFLLWLLRHVRLVVVSVALALLLAALLQPAAARVRAKGVPRLATAWIVLVAFVVALGVVLSLVGAQFAGQVGDVGKGVAAGLDQAREWLTRGPLQLGRAQVEDLTERAMSFLKGEQGSLGAYLSSGLGVAGGVVTGFLLTLFVLFFFLADGRTIWLWVLKFVPVDARDEADAAGRRGWEALVRYVRGIALVALIDSSLVAVALLVLGVPLVVPLAVLTFLAAFVPIIGAAVAGGAAVLVALVEEGPVTAGILLVVILIVQQLDGNVLEPLVLGHAVHVHPLAVGLSIAVGSAVAGLLGAVVAVPLVAALNAAVGQLSHTNEGVGDASRSELS